VVGAYQAQSAFLERFDRRNERYVVTLEEIAFVRAWLMPVITLVGNLAILILLFWGGAMVVEGSLHFGDVSAFAVYVGNVVASLYSLGWVVNVIQRGGISLERVMEVLDDQPQVPEVTATLPDGALSIEAKGLTFRYPESDRDVVLKDISFVLEAGATLGILGTTGSGKSTLLRLLNRLELPPPNTLFVGGVDVCSLNALELRAAMAVVPQQPYLFGRSLKDNVQMGVGDDALSDERVMELLRQACLIEDLDALPDGIETIVGERGVTLSGGQRQRTALARAFARSARILVLDDALSAVDHDTEQRLIASIYEGTERRTTILVSHRVSVLRHADTILVFHDGRIVQQGTHEELIQRDGLYSEAWRKSQVERQREGVGDLV
jgi:ABC-type multidrug transport system fused ATPase/permease subunit